jgi:AcrR family transcriptional regulator
MSMRVNREARAAQAAQRRAETRERLIRAALQVVADKGPEAVTVEDFTAAAGVSRPTFYNYFETVPELLLALNARLTAEVDGRLGDLRTSIDDPVVRLAAMLHRIWIAIAEDPQRGWVAARIETMGAPRVLSWDQDFASLYGRAVRAGRFVEGGYEAARSVTFGAMRMAMRDLYLGLVDIDHAAPLVTAILVACGLPRAEAEEISRDQGAKARAAAG